MKLALYQNKPVFGETDDNINDVIDAVKDRQFDVLVLPELFATGYQFRNRSEAFSLAEEAAGGNTFRRMHQLAAEKKALIVYGFPEKKEDCLFNSALAVAPDGTRHIYQKTHLFDTEKRIFDPGETGFFIFDYQQAKIGMIICFDWRFPESVRKLALLGAQIICHPANLVLTSCPDAMITRAIENLVYTITSDRIGQENRTGELLEFIGRSRIISPDGKILAELGRRETGFVSAEVNPQLADNKAITAANDLFKDRRPELY